MKSTTRKTGGLKALTTGIGPFLLALASANLASAQTNTKAGTNALISVTTGTNNTANGYSALQLDTVGSFNTAVGSLSLKSNVFGEKCTAVGYGALTVSTASDNTAFGYAALFKNTTGALNTAIGDVTLYNNTTGASKVAVGYQTLNLNTTGGFNTAIGDGALMNNTTGSGNIALGEDAGFNLTVGSNNISIGNKGVPGESGKIRIGTSPTHTDTYLTGVIHGNGSGLTGVTVPAASVTGQITGAQIGAGTLTSTNILTGSINSASFANGSVTAAKLGADVGVWSVSGGNLARSAGNVGIGTTTPGARLEVSEGARPEIANFIQTNPSLNADVWWTTASISWLLSGHTSSRSLRFYNGSYVMTLTPESKVGIGTTTPGAKLEVSEGDRHEVANFIQTNPSLNADVWWKAPNTSWLLSGHTSSRSLRFYNGSYVMTLTPESNVGIGTTTPGQKLTVAGMIESTSGGFKFPDGSTQTTATLKGPRGAAGADGKTVLNGTGVPAGSLGATGDFFIDTTAHHIYGPRSSSGWGSPTALVGLQGLQGIQGPPGSGSLPTGPAGGDLTGTYPNPTVAATAITAAKLASDAASLAKVSGGFMNVFGGQVNVQGPVQSITSFKVLDNAGGVGALITKYNGGAATYNIYGSDGNPISVMSFPSGSPDRGAVSVLYKNTIKAVMYVNSSGQGVIAADVKPFRVPNPNKAGTDIWYAALEGPEAGAYTRGTARLVHGKATITLPEHFIAVSNAAGMTVQVTPLSSDSKGLAIVKKSLDGVKVKELFDGTGTYDFDYEVKCVRKGYEDWKVIRPTSEIQPEGTAQKE